MENTSKVNGVKKRGKKTTRLRASTGPEKNPYRPLPEPFCLGEETQR